MKILVNHAQYSDKFIALTNAVYECKNIEVGTAQGKIEDESIIGYQPDVVIHNNPELVHRLKSQNRVQIFIHDSTPIYNGPSIDLSAVGPCIDRHLVKRAVFKDRYASDITVCANINLFDNEILTYSTSKYKLRIFDPKPNTLPYYCGVIPRNEYPSAYRSAFVSPFSLKEDKSRLYEIVASRGRPVVYDPSNPLSFHEKMNLALSDASYTDVVISEDEIQSVMNTRLLPKLLSDLGFKKLSDLIIKGSV